MSTVTHPDGQLQAALTAVHTAVNTLIEPCYDTAGRAAPSLYTQLCQAAFSPSHGQNHVPRSVPPLYVDALDLRREIDDRIALEQPGCHSTPGRLELIANRAYRPQDVHWLNGLTGALQAWATQIFELLNPTPKPTHSAPCPTCGTRTVHHRDSTGEYVRAAALQFGPRGCTCQACKTCWPPEHFALLAAILDTPTPVVAANR